MTEVKHDSYLEMRIPHGLRSKLGPYIKDRQATQLVVSLLRTFFKDDGDIQAIEQRNLKLQQTVNESLAQIAANNQRMDSLRRAAQETEVQMAAENQFRSLVQERKHIKGGVDWRHIAQYHPAALVLKHEAKARILLEEVGYHL